MARVLLFSILDRNFSFEDVQHTDVMVTKDMMSPHSNCLAILVILLE